MSASEPTIPALTPDPPSLAQVRAQKDEWRDIALRSNLDLEVVVAERDRLRAAMGEAVQKLTEAEDVSEWSVVTMSDNERSIVRSTAWHVADDLRAALDGGT